MACTYWVSINVPPHRLSDFKTSAWSREERSWPNWSGFSRRRYKEIKVKIVLQYRRKRRWIINHSVLYANATFISGRLGQCKNFTIRNDIFASNRTFVSSGAIVSWIYYFKKRTLPPSLKLARKTRVYFLLPPVLKTLWTHPEAIWIICNHMQNEPYGYNANFFKQQHDNIYTYGCITMQRMKIYTAAILHKNWVG